MCKSEKDNHHSRYLTKGVVHNRGTVGKIFNQKKKKKGGETRLMDLLWRQPHRAPLNIVTKKQAGRIIINPRFFQNFK